MFTLHRSVIFLWAIPPVSPPPFSPLAFYKNTENCHSCSRRNFWHFVKLINNICIPKIHYISIYVYNELFKTKHNILWAATSIEFYRLSWYANIFFEFAQFISRKRQFSLVFSPTIKENLRISTGELRKQGLHVKLTLRKLNWFKKIKSNECYFHYYKYILSPTVNAQYHCQRY